MVKEHAMKEEHITPEMKESEKSYSHLLKTIFSNTQVRSVLNTIFPMLYQGLKTILFHIPQAGLGHMGKPSLRPSHESPAVLD